MFDSSGNLYVANTQSNTVAEYAAGSTVASFTYSTGLSQPTALAIDASGNLYVANNGNDTVLEFAPGRTTPTASYFVPAEVLALAFDPAGNLYVAELSNNEVLKFAPGSTTASTTYMIGINEPVSRLRLCRRPVRCERSQQYGDQIPGREHLGHCHAHRTASPV